MKLETKQCASAQTPELTLPPRLMKTNLRRDEASEYLDLAHSIRQLPGTLAKKASLRDGPYFFKLRGGTPLYPRAGLDAWAAYEMGETQNYDWNPE